MLNFDPKMQAHLILFISGGGSNARQIISYFEGNERIKVVGLLSSKPNEVMQGFCADHSVPYYDMTGNDFSSYLKITKDLSANWIVLAGFLKKVPVELISAFPNRIINIHPSLLPKYGGAGMFGKHVHKAVSDAKEAFSGISIHLVNEEFDKGLLLFQHAVALSKGANVEETETKVRALEQAHFAPDLELYLSNPAHNQPA